mmetsp:Transcript_25896/g.62579  ORF Transcript_25896/g.62579 Transcript_25896/m.62579 type:complete len:190 (-) Transcript_25896:1389-1958(-)
MIVGAALVAVLGRDARSAAREQKLAAAQFPHLLAARGEGIIAPPRRGRPTQHWWKGFQNCASEASALTPTSSPPALGLPTLGRVAPKLLAYHRRDPAPGLAGVFPLAFEEAMSRHLPVQLVGQAMTYEMAPSPGVSLHEALHIGKAAGWCPHVLSLSSLVAITSMGPPILVQKVGTSALGRSATRWCSL